MEDKFDYFAEIISNALRSTKSWLGLGSIILSVFIEYVFFGISENIAMDILSKIAFAFVFVFAVMLIWQARSAYAFVELKPVVERDYKYNHDVAYLSVTSQEPTRIIFSAKVVELDFLSQMNNVLYKHHQDLGVLKWDNDDSVFCFNPHDTNKIHAAQYLNGISFTYHNSKTKSLGHGVFLIKIRIDGIRDDNSRNSILPRYFQGYIHAFNVVDGKYNYPAMNFREGDWRKDKEIPLEIRSLKIAT
jgi:hypothetical protein